MFGAREWQESAGGGDGAGCLQMCMVYMLPHLPWTHWAVMALQPHRGTARPNGPWCGNIIRAFLLCVSLVELVGAFQAVPFVVCRVYF